LELDPIEKNWMQIGAKGIESTCHLDNCNKSMTLNIIQKLFSKPILMNDHHWNLT
jgi:hypothetical protein